MNTLTSQENITLDSQLDALNFLDSIIDELPDQRAPKIDQREQYAAEKKHRDELKKAVEKAAQNAYDQYIRHNPEAINLKCISNTFIKKRDPLKQIDLKRYYEQLLNKILFYSDKLTSMSAITREVNKSFPNTPQGANIWTRELPKFQLNKVATMIRGNKPNLNVRLKGCKTFKDIRQAILNAQTKANDSIRIKAEIVISSDKIIVNQTSYDIQDNSTKSYNYKRVRVPVKDSRQWLNVEALIALLQTK